MKSKLKTPQLSTGGPQKDCNDYNCDAAWEKGPYFTFLLNENSCNECEVMYVTSMTLNFFKWS